MDGALEGQAQGDPSPMVVGAIAAHELWRSYIAGGFTEEQALKIVIAFMLDNYRRTRESEEGQE